LLVLSLPAGTMHGAALSSGDASLGVEAPDLPVALDVGGLAASVDEALASAGGASGNETASATRRARGMGLVQLEHGDSGWVQGPAEGVKESAHLSGVIVDDNGFGKPVVGLEVCGGVNDKCTETGSDGGWGLTIEGSPEKNCYGGGRCDHEVWHYGTVSIRGYGDRLGSFVRRYKIGMQNNPDDNRIKFNKHVKSPKYREMSTNVYIPPALFESEKTDDTYDAGPYLNTTITGPVTVDQETLEEMGNDATFAPYTTEASLYLPPGEYTVKMRWNTGPKKDQIANTKLFTVEVSMGLDDPDHSRYSTGPRRLPLTRWSSREPSSEDSPRESKAGG